MERDFDNFDEFAKNYREIHNENIRITGVDSDYFAEYKIIELTRKEDSSAPLKIIDLGCGDGISAVFFHKHFPGSTYTGIDISEDSIAEAKLRKVPNTAYKSYDGFNIPFAENTFDVAFVACVMHHILPKHHQQILTEIKRVLKPKGRLYIFEHNPYNPLTVKVVEKCVFDEDAILLPPPYSKKILKESGFTRVQLFFTLFFPRKGIFRLLLGLEKWMSWLPLGGQYYTRVVKS